MENPPLAIKFLKPGEANPEGFDIPARKMRFCQAVMEASWGKFLVLKPSEMACGPGPASFGEPMREKVARGETLQAIGLFGSTDAAAKCLANGQRVMVFNSRGEAVFNLSVTSRVPSGVVVAEGVWWLQKVPGIRSVNVLTSQRLTDRGAGSTFYDTKVDVRAE